MLDSTLSLKTRLAIAATALACALALLPAADAGAAFDLVRFTGVVANEDGTTASEAGLHPYKYVTTFETSELGFLEPDGQFKDVEVDLAPGFVGNPAAVPAKCTPTQLSGEFSFSPTCPVDSQVGFATLWAPIGSPGSNFPLFPVSIFAMAAEEDRLPYFGMAVGGVLIYLTPTVRPDGNYTLRVSSSDTAQGLPVTQTDIEFWGDPTDPSHDPSRQCPGTSEGGCAATADPYAFLSNSTDCADGPLPVSIRMNSWEDPADFKTASYVEDSNGNSTAVTGCNQLEFDPSLEARPTTTLADTPSGLDVKIETPQNEDPEGRATSHLKDVTLELPAGLVVNPSSADGLASCSPAQIALGQDAANGCPDASKLGTVELDSPLLEDVLSGAVYLAAPHDNPFDSLVALYIVVDLPNGQEVKLAGRTDLDPATGQITARFEQNPQIPFDSLEVHLKQGPRAPLRTPLACGEYESTSTMTPWSAPELAAATRSDSFELTAGPNASPCLADAAAAPNAASFAAGTIDPTAGAFSPLIVRVARNDGTQELRSIDATLPPGLLGKLAGVPYCSDGAIAAAGSRESGVSEQASPSCPAASQVGTVQVGLGAGSTPLYVGAKAYLAGPYKGAPLSLAIVTPAVAGPFDLGVVVVRTALQVDPASARIHAVSDPLPSILDGIPLDIRSVALRMDRPNFTLNPTSCEPMATLGTITSLLGQSLALSSPFKAADCGRLGFKPKLTMALTGGVKRRGHPAIHATYTARPGDANTRLVSVALPKSQLLDNAHIGNVCTRVQFAAGACPASSVLGTAVARTPLLDAPLAGNVYLRSGDNPLPDLLVDLRGQIDVQLLGRVDTVNGGALRTSFETAPDAPVSSFKLDLAGGRKGLIINSRSLCQGKAQKARVRSAAHNGAARDFQVKLNAKGCGKKSGKKGKR